MASSSYSNKNFELVQCSSVFIPLPFDKNNSNIPQPNLFQFKSLILLFSFKYSYIRPFSRRVLRRPIESEFFHPRCIDFPTDYLHWIDQHVFWHAYVYAYWLWRAWKSHIFLFIIFEDVMDMLDWFWSSQNLSANGVRGKVYFVAVANL